MLEAVELQAEEPIVASGDDVIGDAIVVFDISL